MVGRDAEVSLLLSALTLAGSGEPQVALVRGEAGIGKTRLVRELAARVPEATVVAFGHTVPLSGGSMPYGVAGDLLRSLVREVGVEAVEAALGSRAAALAPLVPRLGPDSPSPVDRVSLYAVTQDLLVELASDRTVLLVLEDLHWADESSLDLLVFWARTLVRGRLMLVATHRDVGVDQTVLRRAAELRRLPNAVVAEISPLATDEVETHVRLLHEMAGADLVADIQRLSDGNPLFVEELVLAGDQRQMGSALELDLTGRLAAMSSEAADVLRLAALEVRPFEPATLVDVSGAPRATVEAALDEARGLGLLVCLPERRWRFHHELLRMAAAGSVSDVTAGRLRWAEVLAGGPRPTPEDLVAAADHYAAAGTTQAAFTARVRAAEELRRVAADVVESTHQWRLALDLLHQDPTLSPPEDYDRVLAMAVDRVLESDAGFRTLVAVEGRVTGRGTDVRSTWLTVAQWFLNRGAGQVGAATPDASELRRAGLTLTQASATALALSALELLRHVWQARGENEEVARIAAVIQEWAPRLAQEHAGAVTAAVVSRLSSYEGLTQAELTSMLEWATALGEGADDAATASIWVRYGYGLVADGYLEEALQACERGLALIAGPHLDHRWYGVAATTAEVAFMLGKWEALPAMIERCQEEDASVSVKKTVLAIDAMVALWRTGRVDRELPAHVPDGSMTLGLDGYKERHMAELVHAWQVHETDPIKARRDLGPWLDEADAEAHTLSFEAFQIAAELAAREPRDQAFTSLVVQAVGRLTAVPYERALRRMAQAHLAHAAGTGTPDRWLDAVAAADQLGVRYFSARLRRQLAEALIAAGDRAGAAGALAEALSIAEPLGARPLADEIRSLAARSRVRLPGQEPAEATGTGPLTAREHEVLQLVVTGMTNDQIGAALFMSPRTASVHVSRILAKLGAANRTEVAAVAHRRGLVGD